MTSILSQSRGTFRRGVVSRVSSPLQLRQQLLGSASRRQSRSFATGPSSKPEQKTHSTENSEDKRAAQQNRHAIDRQSDEVSLSGTDDAVAAQMSVSFDKTKDNMGQVRAESGEQNAWGNPLDGSPANRSLSEGTDEVKSGADTKSVASKPSHSRGDSKMKQGNAGFEKKAFAGSSRTVKESERGETVRPGAR